MDFQRQVTFNAGGPPPAASRSQTTGAGMQRAIFWAMGLACSALGLVTMFANGMFALKFGSTAVETGTMVVASVGIDALKIGLLLPVSNMWRHDRSKATLGFVLWGACFCWSLFSAYGFAVALRGDASAHNVKAYEDRAAIVDRVARSKAQLGALATVRPASALRAEIVARKSKMRAAGQSVEKCDRNTDWVPNYCGPLWQLEADLATAEDATRLEAAVRADQDRLSGMPVVSARADQQIDSLAAITGYAAAALMVISTVFFSALIEMASAIGPVIVATGARYAQDRPDPMPAPVPEAVMMTIDQPPAMGSFEEGFGRWANCLVQDTSGKLSSPAAYAHFGDWCRFNGPYAIGSAPAFGRLLRQHALALGALEGRTGIVGKTYTGIRIRDTVTQMRLPSAAQ